MAEVSLAERIILIDFKTDWCESCKMLDPIVDEIAQEHEGEVIVWKVDAQANRNLTERFQVINIPTIVFQLGDKTIDKISGIVTKEQLKEKIESIIKTTKQEKSDERN